MAMGIANWQQYHVTNLFVAVTSVSYPGSEPEFALLPTQLYGIHLIDLTEYLLIYTDYYYDE